MEKKTIGRSELTEKKILEGLTPQQKRAVTYGDGALLIVAGAGTGKTLVLTRRIAYLIATKRAKPEEILALTFTEKAATEMEERVDVLVPYGYMNVWISTFHAFGDRILREHALELGLTPDFRVLSKSEQIIFFREHLSEFPLNYYCPLSDPTRHIDALVTLYSRAKDEDVNPEEYLLYSQELEKKAHANPLDEELREIASKQMEIAATFEKYQTLLAQHGMIDFGDQVTLSLKLFRNHPFILRQYQEKFRYILIDEFQDTNYAQFQLVKLLAARHRNITVVGDDDQSIYKFRGAAISNILGFMDAYPQAEQIVLTENFRSTRSILDTAYRLISYNNPERLEIRNNIDKRLITKAEEGLSVKYLSYDTLSSEAEGVVQLIEQKVTSGHYNYKDFAILVRANIDADPFLRALNMRSIPWRFTGNQGLYSREEIRLLIAFLRVISNFSDSLSLYHLASSEIYQLNPMDLTRCLNYASRKHLTLYEVFIHLGEIKELEEIPPKSRLTISKILTDIEHFVHLSISRPTGEVLYQFLIESGYLKSLTYSSSEGNEEKVKNLAKFFEIVESTSKVILMDRVPQFVSHLDMLIKAGDDPPVAEADLEANAVNVLTVHKAKGLEFPVVFLVGLVSDRFPSRHRREPIELPEALIKDVLPGGDFHLQEERRLFYVGMTRAQKELYLSSSRDYGKGRPKKVSQFVLEALDLPHADKEIYKASAEEALQRYAPKISSKGELYGPIDDNELLTLSYYQIDDYLTCPLKYKFVHILRVPILQHHTVIYGKALHDAVQEYQRRKIQGRKMSEEELITVFEASWISEGFLTREHEEQRLAAGRAALRLFYQTEEASGEIPSYVEKDFCFMLGNDRIIGRWDRIDEKDGEVTIIDFKSSDIRKQKEADRRAKESLQLSIYALAYREAFGKIPERVELRFLESGLVGVARKTKKDLAKTIEKIKEAAQGVRSRNYEAKPDYFSCLYCAYREICPNTESRI